MTDKPAKPKTRKQSAKFRVSHGLIDNELGLFDGELAKQSEEAARFGGKPDATRIGQAMLDAIESAPVELSIAPTVVTTEVKFAATNADQAGGIEILIKMATAGEIDPKNIDIIDVTDKFLKAIAAVPKENLRQSGKILFHASVLLRMKAEAMLAAAVAADAVDDFVDFEEDDGSLSFDGKSEPRQLTLLDLERALVRKANNRQNRQRKVTLDQLIDALREAEKIEKTRQAREPRQRIELAGQHSANDVGDLLDLAHDEDIEDTISRVESILKSAIGEGELVQLLRIIQLLGGHGDWVDAFLAVLFLSNAGKLTLEQKDFYGPLYVVRGDVPVESDSEEPASSEASDTAAKTAESKNLEQRKKPTKTKSVKAKSKTISADVVDADSVNAEAVDANAVNAEAVDANAVDAESVDANAVDAESVDANAVNAESIDATAVDEHAADTELVTSETVEDDTTEAESINLETIDTDPTNAEPINLETVPTDPIKEQEKILETPCAVPTVKESEDTESINVQPMNAESINVAM
ncbi:MAG TPA: segregation/condensation protein A [Drouetiella sp.]|jgi:segregation and condensation protein A